MNDTHEMPSVPEKLKFEWISNVLFLVPAWELNEGAYPLCAGENHPIPSSVLTDDDPIMSGIKAGPYYAVFVDAENRNYNCVGFLFKSDAEHWIERCYLQTLIKNAEHELETKGNG